MKLYCGVDEVGRGPLAGPVVAAAVILDPGDPISGLADSKQLSAAKREQLATAIRGRALSWALGRAEVEEVDRLNVLHASLLAMRRAILALDVPPEWIQVDGNRLPPELPCRAEAIVGGDGTVPAISAASIIAKVARDAEMTALEDEFPGYGFAQHKGYPTKAHLAALSRLGVTPVHRKSFAPVRRIIADDRL